MKIKGLKHITLTRLELIQAALSDDDLSKRREQQVQENGNKFWLKQHSDFLENRRMLRTAIETRENEDSG